MSFTAKYVLDRAADAVAEHGTEHREPRGQFLRWSVEANRWVPNCLVGHVAIAAGVEIAQLVMVNSESVTESARPIFAGRFTEQAIDLLAVAQRMADKGGTWGDALDEMRLRWQMIAGRELVNQVSSVPNPAPLGVVLFNRHDCPGAS